MKNLKLNQMEKITGSGYCDIASRYRFMYSISGLAGLAAAWGTYAALCRAHGNVYTFE